MILITADPLDVLRLHSPVPDGEDKTVLGDLLHGRHHALNLRCSSDDAYADTVVAACTSHEPVFLVHKVLCAINGLERCELSGCWYKKLRCVGAALR